MSSRSTVLSISDRLSGGTKPTLNPTSHCLGKHVLGHHAVDCSWGNRAVGGPGLVGVWSDSEAHAHAAERLRLSFGDAGSHGEPSNESPQARNKRIVEARRETDTNPMGRCLPKSTLKRDGLMQVIANGEILRRRLNRRLVHDTVALERMHVAHPKTTTRLRHGEVERRAHGQLSQDQVPTVGSGKNGADGGVARRLDSHDAEKRCQFELYPVNVFRDTTRLVKAKEVHIGL